MLKQLYISNFTLIDKLNIPFYPGFSVITGETGAGKSIILGAIGLLLGNRADVKQVKAGERKCVIEAHFDLSRYDMEVFFDTNDIDYDDPSDCILRREVNASGKSRAFINDQPVSLTIMRELGEQLIDIHSQHQNLLLQKDDFQLHVIDIIAHDQKQIADYEQAYEVLAQEQNKLENLKAEIARGIENEDFMRFQFKELTQASLQEGELSQLEHDTEAMGHVEEIKSALYQADELLASENSGSVSSVKDAASTLRSVEKVFPEVSELAQRLDSTYIELKDISQEISTQLDHIDFDPKHYQELSDRLDLIYSLEQKYHVANVSDLIALRDKLESELGNIDNSGESVRQQELVVKEAETKCRQLAEKLTVLRQKAALQVEKEMQSRLVPLGIPNVRFAVQMQTRPLGRKGQDKACFLFSANKSSPMQPVAQIASGGEIARVMLSLKAMISGAVKLPTIIFDEVDTGVSGRVAEQMAKIMREMGNNDRQVISITHLPQIAAMGDHHYKVSKEETEQGTVSQMSILTDNQRVKEIAQMLSGSDVTQAAIDNAMSLLNNK